VATLAAEPRRSAKNRPASAPRLTPRPLRTTVARGTVIPRMPPRWGSVNASRPNPGAWAPAPRLAMRQNHLFVYSLAVALFSSAGCSSGGSSTSGPARAPRVQRRRRHGDQHDHHDHTSTGGTGGIGGAGGCTQPPHCPRHGRSRLRLGDLHRGPVRDLVRGERHTDAHPAAERLQDQHVRRRRQRGAIADDTDKPNDANPCTETSAPAARRRTRTPAGTSCGAGSCATTWASASAAPSPRLRREHRVQDVHLHRGVRLEQHGRRHGDGERDGRRLPVGSVVTATATYHQRDRQQRQAGRQQAVHERRLHRGVRRTPARRRHGVQPERRHEVRRPRNCVVCTQAVDCGSAPPARRSRATRRVRHQQRRRRHGGGEPDGGDCRSNQCDGSGAVTMNAVDNTDLPATTATSAPARPASRARPRPERAAGTTCNQGGGNTCNGNGACVTCVMASDCAPTRPVRRTPARGRVQREQHRHGTVVANPTLATAAPTSATATAGSRSTRRQRRSPADDGKQCTGETCVAGAPQHPPTSSGSACNQGGGNRCNGAGPGPVPRGGGLRATARAARSRAPRACAAPTTSPPARW